MHLVIDKLLNQDQIVKVASLLTNAKFVEGSSSAGRDARRVKNNLEISMSDDQAHSLNQLVMGSLVSHPEFKRYALPHRVAAPYYSCYQEGMYYGEHIDDPIMGEGARYRSDLSITIFLNDPTQYDGGELSIKSGSREEKFKLPAGSAILYPANSLHSVSKITRGTRYAAVTWVQSLIRNSEQREILYSLATAYDELQGSGVGGDIDSRVNHAYVNLVRMWSEV